jgi:hypothetical protein
MCRCLPAILEIAYDKLIPDAADVQEAQRLAALDDDDSANVALTVKQNIRLCRTLALLRDPFLEATCAASQLFFVSLIPVSDEHLGFHSTPVLFLSLSLR